MVQEFDLLQSKRRRSYQISPEDPGGGPDTFRSRFAPFSEDPADILNEGERQYYERQRYIPVPFDPNKTISGRLPPAIGAPMASSGAPPAGAFPPARQMPPPTGGPGGPPQDPVAAASGIPRAATAVPPGLPGPGGYPVGSMPGVGGLPPQAPAAPQGPVADDGSIGLGPNGELPPGFSPAPGPGIFKGMYRALDRAGLGGHPGPEGGLPEGGPTTELKGDLGVRGVGARLQNQMPEALQALPDEALKKVLASPGNAASTAQWARAFQRLQDNPTPYSIAAFRLATRNLSNNLGVNIDPQSIVDRSAQSPTPSAAPATAPEDAAASGGSEAAAAREAAAMRMLQGVRGGSRYREPGADRPGKTQDIVRALGGMVDPRRFEAPMRAILSSPYTAGMTPEDYTDQPGADYPQQQLTNMAAPMAVSQLASSITNPSFPRGAPAAQITPQPQISGPPPQLALPPPRQLPPGFMEQLQQAIQPPRTPMNLGELPPAAPSGRRSAGHYGGRDTVTPSSLEDLASAIQEYRAAPSRRRSRGHFNQRLELTPEQNTQNLIDEVLRTLSERR